MNKPQRAHTNANILLDCLAVLYQLWGSYSSCKDFQGIFYQNKSIKKLLKREELSEHPKICKKFSETEYLKTELGINWSWKHWSET